MRDRLCRKKLAKMQKQYTDTGKGRRVLYKGPLRILTITQRTKPHSLVHVQPRKSLVHCLYFYLCPHDPRTQKSEVPFGLIHINDRGRERETGLRVPSPHHQTIITRPLSWRQLPTLQVFCGPALGLGSTVPGSLMAKIHVFCTNTSIDSSPE